MWRWDIAWVYIATLAAFILATAVGIGIWVAFTRAVLRQRGSITVASVGSIATASLQFLLASYLIYFSLNPNGEALWGGLVWPLLGLFVPAYEVATHFTFLREPLLFSAIVAGVVGALHYRYVDWGRIFWPTTMVLAGFLSLVVAGEVELHLELVKAAAALQPDCLTSDSFFGAIAGGRDGHRDNLYATAIKDGAQYGWSYRASDFYEIPESVNGVHTQPGAWFSLPYRACP